MESTAAALRYGCERRRIRRRSVVIAAAVLYLFAIVVVVDVKYYLERVKQWLQADEDEREDVQHYEEKKGVLVKKSCEIRRVPKSKVVLF